MTKLTALHAEITGDATGIKAASVQAETALKGVAKNASSVGASSALASPKIRMMSMQLSQVAQQGAATGNYLQALAIQAPDLALGFGAIGIMAGAAIPILYGVAQGFLGAGKNARTLDDDMDDLTDGVKALNTALTTLQDVQSKYATAIITGQRDVADGLRQELELRSVLLDIQRIEIEQKADAITAARRAQIAVVNGIQAELAIRRQMLAETEAAAGTAEYDAIAEEIERISGELRSAQLELSKFVSEGKLSELQINRIDAAIAAAAAATANLAAGGRDAAAAFLDAANNATAMARAVADANSGRMALARRELTQLPGEGANAVAFDRDRERQRLIDRYTPSPSGGSSGGAARQNPIIAELEMVQNALATQEELQLETFARQQEALQSALEQRLLTQEEYNDLMERSQQQHADAMTRIDAYRYGDTLARTSAFMGGMADAFAQGNDKMLKISKVFGAAQALIDAWRAHNQVLADPTLPFWMKIPAALQVLGAGLGAVSAIKGLSSTGGGGGGGGGGGSGGGSSWSGAAGADSAARSSAVTLQLVGGDMFSRDQVVQLIGQINEAQEGGAVVNLV